MANTIPLQMYFEGGDIHTEYAKRSMKYIQYWKRHLREILRVLNLKKDNGLQRGNIKIQKANLSILS